MPVYLIKENGLTLKKKEAVDIRQKYHEADYENDLALLANTSTQVECLLHNLEQLLTSSLANHQRQVNK